MPTAGEELLDAIENLYEVFRRYPLRPRIGGCSHCVFPADDELLHRTPLRRLSIGDLQKFARKSMTTFGDQSDFKHFLPRLFELAAVEREFGDTDLEILFSKLDYEMDPRQPTWMHWPPDESQAVNRYLRALWSDILSSDPDAPYPQYEVGSWLCVIAQTRMDLAPLLAEWASRTDASAVRQLAAFIVDAADEVYRGKELNAFWKEHRDQEKVLVQWVLLTNLGAQFERAFFDYSTKPFADELSNAQVIWAGLHTYGVSRLGDARTSIYRGE